VVAQLVEDLLHFEGGEDGLDQDRRPMLPGHADRILGELEDVIPEPRFEVAFELGQVEVGPLPFSSSRLALWNM